MANANCPEVVQWVGSIRQITVTPNALLGVLAYADESYCTSGDPAAISFATAPSGGSGSYSYQWYYQDGDISCPVGSSTTGWTIISGATTNTYDPPTISASRTYACYVSVASNASCPATAGWATQCRKVIIGGTVNYGTIASGNQTVCPVNGDPSIITLQTVPSGGSGNFTYQWYYQDGLITCPTGSSTNGWTIISGATTASYDPPTGLTASRTYACFVSLAAGNGCVASVGWAAQCRQITISTAPNFGTITNANETFCAPGDPALITFATPATGGSSSFSYQWYYKSGIISCPTGSTANGWTAISGATSATYDPATTVFSRTFACFVTANAGIGCLATTGWATGCRQVTIAPAINFGTLAPGNENLCGTANPTAISFSSTPTGGSGNFTYQWYYADGDFICPGGNTTTGWTIISGATSASYDPPQV
ncbi:MAG: hypothetical protein M0D57_08685 [Sphingobacteriales bacterium JAD_PAG50586_3]|nr:MAG: hypothetical protein M0D57_08685 [Sphingobacteriales bacterium JAD_PAG50586_3]